MSIVVYRKPKYNGDPNGLLDGPKNTLFHKKGKFYKINYSGSLAPIWQPVYFVQTMLPNFMLTAKDKELLIQNTGSYLYVKTSNLGSKSGWTLLAEKDPTIYIIPPTPSPSPTPTSTPTPTPTSTATPTPTPTTSATPVPTPTSPPPSTPTPTPFPTPSPTPTSTPTPTASPTPSPSPTPTSTPAPSPTSSPTPTPSSTPIPSPTPTPSPTVYGGYVGYAEIPGGIEQFP